MRGKDKPCVWNGIEYPTMAHAARALGISKQAMTMRVNAGYTSDKDMKQNQHPQSTLSEAEKKLIFAYLTSNHVTMTIREIARKFGVKKSQVEDVLYATRD